MEYLKVYKSNDEVVYHVSTPWILATEPREWKRQKDLFFPTEVWEDGYISEENLFEFALGNDVQKIVAEFRQRNGLENLEVLCNNLGVQTFNTVNKPGRYRLEMCQTDKANGLSQLQSILGIKAEETLAFGDGINDLPMLINNIGVAMGNASPDIKDVCRFITSSNVENGIAKFLEQYVL